MKLVLWEVRHIDVKWHSEQEFGGHFKLEGQQESKWGGRMDMGGSARKWKFPLLLDRAVSGSRGSFLLEWGLENQDSLFDRLVTVRQAFRVLILQCGSDSGRRKSKRQGGQWEGTTCCLPVTVLQNLLIAPLLQEALLNYPKPPWSLSPLEFLLSLKLERLDTLPRIEWWSPEPSICNMKRVE